MIKHNLKEREKDRKKRIKKARKRVCNIQDNECLKKIKKVLKVYIRNYKERKKGEK